MRISTLIRWAGPGAIAGGVFMVFSELSSLPVHVPFLSREAPTGYDAVASGLILFALVLLLVGMLGLYAGRAESGGPRVLESGAVYTRGEDPELLEVRWLAVESETSPSGHGRASAVPVPSSDRHSG